jgi:hypothetical protein
MEPMPRLTLASTSLARPLGRCLLLLATLFASQACDKPPPPAPPKPPAVAAAPHNQGAAFAPDVIVKLSSLPAIGTPELLNTEGVAALDTDKTVLILPILIENKSAKKVTYTPSINANGSPTPNLPIQLLGLKDAEIKEDSSRETLKRVSFSPYTLPGQITSSTEIPPGGKLSDLLVFDTDGLDAFSRFLLVLPGNTITTERDGKRDAPGDLAILDMGFDSKKFLGIEIQAADKVGDWLKHGPLEVRITKLTPGPVPLVSRSAKPGDPDFENPKHRASYDLLKVEFELRNAGEDTLKYRPIHDKDDIKGLTLEGLVISGDKVQSETLGFAVIRDTNLVPKGQVASRSEDLLPGRTLKDFFLFDMPPDDVNRLDLSISGHLLAEREPRARGLFRFQLPYKAPAPAAPEPPPAPAPAPDEAPK